MVTLTPDDLGASHHHADGQEYGKDEHDTEQTLHQVRVADLDCARRPDAEHHGNPKNRNEEAVDYSQLFTVSFLKVTKKIPEKRGNDTVSVT